MLKFVKSFDCINYQSQFLAVLYSIRKHFCHAQLIIRDFFNDFFFGPDIIVFISVRYGTCIYVILYRKSVLYWFYCVKTRTLFEYHKKILFVGIFSNFLRKLSLLAPLYTDI